MTGPWTTLPPAPVAAPSGAITAAVRTSARGCGWRPRGFGRWAQTAVAAANMIDPLPADLVSDYLVSDYLHPGWPRVTRPAALITAGVALPAINVGRQGTDGWTRATLTERTTR